MTVFYLIVIIFFVLLAILFGLQNASQIVREVNFLNWQVTNIPLIIVLFHAMAVGVVFALILAVMFEIKLRRKIRRQSKQIGELNDMLKSTLAQTRAQQQRKRLDLQSLCGQGSYRSYLQRRILESQDVLAEKQRELEAGRAAGRTAERGPQHTSLRSSPPMAWSRAGSAIATSILWKRNWCSLCPNRTWL